MGVMIDGKQGPRLNPAVASSGSPRRRWFGMLSAIDLEPDAKSQTAQSRAARAAAHARWQNAGPSRRNPRRMKLRVNSESTVSLTRAQQMFLLRTIKRCGIPTVPLPNGLVGRSRATNRRLLVRGRRDMPASADRRSPGPEN